MGAWQRGARLVGLAIALASIDARVARPQDDDKPAAAGPGEPISAGANGASGAAGGSGAATGASPASPDDDTGPAGPPAAGPTSPAPADPAARDAWLTAELGGVIRRHPELAKAKIGAAFVDVASGRVLWDHDADGRYNLASCTKLLTSSAALARLGGGFRWRTAIYAEKLDPATGVVDGDLYVRGRGDPTLDDAALRALAVDVRRAGVRKVTGNLVVDDTYFDEVLDPPHYADQPKERSGYRAPVGALGVDGNAVTLVLEPDPAGSAPAVPHLEPAAGDYVRLKKVEVATVKTGRGRVRVDSAASRDHVDLTAVGQIRADGGIDTTRRRIDDPARFAGEVLRAALIDEGLTIGKRIGRGAVPPTARQLAAHDSAELATIVRDMNKFSNNYYAESLLKTLGAEAKLAPGGAHASAPPPAPAPADAGGAGTAGATSTTKKGPPLAGPSGPHASWDDGLAVVRDFLVRDVGLADGSFRVDNGSGLYDASSVAPRALAQVVAHGAIDFRYGPDLIASLATAGVDGTLRKRFAGTAGAGRVRAKTGTLANVSTLGGLVAVDGRRPVAFAILVNDIPDAARGKARVLEDELLGVVLAYLAP